MVPYVRKSFYKHFKVGLRYIEGKKLENSLTPEEFSIKSEEYKRYHKAYIYSMDKTKQEVYQAVESLYHNLNTLQSRSGNPLPFTSINYGTCTEPEAELRYKHSQMLTGWQKQKEAKTQDSEKSAT